jgi:thymidylate synthase
MKPYLDFLGRILAKDRLSKDRTGVGTIKVAGEMMKFPLMRDGVKIVPVTTTKKLYWKGVVTELLWFRDGETNAMGLIAQNNHIWDDWMIPEDVYEYGFELDFHIDTWMLNNDHDCSTPDTRQKGLTAFYDAMALRDGTPGRSSAPSNEECLAFLKETDCLGPIQHRKGDLGPIYGATWRRAPAGNYFKNMSDVEVQDYIDLMAPDQKAVFDTKLGEMTAHWQKAAKEKHLLRAAREILTALGIDQLSQALNKLRVKPDDRRIIVNAWIPEYVPIDHTADKKGMTSAQVSHENVKRGRAALAFCHVLFQFLTEEMTTAERLALVPKQEGGLPAMRSMPLPPELALSRAFMSGIHADTLDRKGRTDEEWLTWVQGGSFTTDEMLDALRIPKYILNCVMYQRSADAFLGVAFNVASYGLLTHMVAQVNNMVPGELTWQGGDCHIYRNAMEQVKLQMTREPYPEPELYLNPAITNLFDFKAEDIQLLNYKHHDPIKATVAV